eukprot:GHVS01091949.1.p1 GENE.GHVS01091949.1~~GHVS01091949.1.p1  ORF type:complete len:110 (+),score=4.89 GHVS01091949.1:455-784(+)
MSSQQQNAKPSGTFFYCPNVFKPADLTSVGSHNIVAHSMNQYVHWAPKVMFSTPTNGLSTATDVVNDVFTTELNFYDTVFRERLQWSAETGMWFNSTNVNVNVKVVNGL